MADLRSFTDADLARLVITATAFRDGDLWRALRTAVLEPEHARITRDLANESTAAETLKFRQGELKQVSRAIMLIDDFLRDVELGRKRRAGNVERT
jgi:hypothetical protein